MQIPPVNSQHLANPGGIVERICSTRCHTVTPNHSLSCILMSKGKQKAAKLDVRAELTQAEFSWKELHVSLNLYSGGYLWVAGMFLFHRCTVKSWAKHHPKLQDELGTVAILPMIFSRCPCELGPFLLDVSHVPAHSIFLSPRHIQKLGFQETGWNWAVVPVDFCPFALTKTLRCVAAFARNWHISIPSCVAPTAWCRSKSRQSRRMGRSRRVSSGNDMGMGPVTYEFAMFFWINIRTSSI